MQERQRGKQTRRWASTWGGEGWGCESPLSCTLCRCLIGGRVDREVSDPGAGGWRGQGDQAWGFSPCARHPFPQMKYCLGFMSQICHLVALGTIAEGPRRQQWPREGHSTGVVWHARCTAPSASEVKLRALLPFLYSQGPKNPVGPGVT